MRQVEVIGNYRYVLNTKTDECIYMKPRVNPDCRDTISGRDLYVHKGSKNGKIIFYTLYWSRWQGTYPSIDVLTKEQAENFLIEQTKTDPWGYPYDQAEEDQLKEYDLNILEEGEIKAK